MSTRRDGGRIESLAIPSNVRVTNRASTEALLDSVRASVAGRLRHLHIQDRTLAVWRGLRRCLRGTPLRTSLASALVLIMTFESVAPAFTANKSNGAAKGTKRTSNRRSAPDKPSLTRQIKAQDTSVEAAVVRHAPTLNGARIEGSVRQLTGENVSLEGNMVVTSALLVPGTPQVVINGTPAFGGATQGTGSDQPSNYTVTINGSVSLGKLVTRNDPIPIPAVDPPPAAAGTRDVTLNNAGQSPGDFATLRDLTLNGSAGNVAVPPGTYGAFTANGNTSFTFGIAGATQPSTYNLNRLALNGSSKLQVVGPVILTLAAGSTLSGSAGSPANPLWLTLRVASGDLILNGGVSLFATVQAPAGTVTLRGNTLLQGSVSSDRLVLSGNSTLKATPGVISSISPAAAVQGQTLNVTLRGNNTHWVQGQTRASFGGEVSVGGGTAGEFGPVTVVDAVTAVADIAVSSTAALAPRTVKVITSTAGFQDDQVETAINGFVVGAVSPPGAASATVSTLAGAAGIPGFADGSPADARFQELAGISVGPDDSIFVADSGNNRIRRVATDGSVSTVAGDGTAGYADGPGASARFNAPQGVAVDASGMVYVADTGNNRIRRIAVDGTVSTVAGDGIAGFQDGAGAQARFSAPRGIALDNQGNAYVADTGNSAVRSVTPSGNVSTVAGDGTPGSSDSPNARFNGLVGIAVDGTTLFVYVADAGNHRIRKLTPSGTTITLVGVDRGFADGSPSQARFADPSGIAVDAAGKLVVADATNSLIRFVDPGLAASGSSLAVSTIAGTGDRGLTNGAGNVARFFTPRGVAVSQSSAIIVADTGSQVLRKILLPPSIIAFSPTRGKAGDSITIAGERFDGRSPSQNVVRFTRTGGGLTDAVVTSATRTQLIAIVPADAATGLITVQTQGGTATSATAFEIANNQPVIADFNPTHGEVGTEVTLTGSSLKADTGPTVVTFAGSNSTRLPALVTFVSATEVRALVPNGAVTGVIDLTNAFGRAVTTASFTVDQGQNDYQIVVAPSSTTAVQGGTATFVVFLTSPLTTFSQLVSLTATGLPQGATALFSPDQITAGAQSTLSVRLSGTSPAPGSYSFTIRGSGIVDGVELVRTAAASINVLASGQTTLSGRVLSTESEPIMGATVSLDGKTATTDAAGGFLLTAVTAGVDRPLMVDGRTASAPNRTYPLIIEPATVVAGQANVIPFSFYLPAIDTQFEVEVVPGQMTEVMNPRVPGLEMMIPPDAHLRNRDGSPVARVSITPLAVDRTPAPLPDDVGTNLVYTSQPGGAISDVPMPVVYPNLAGADPGTRIELYAFNHDTVQWFVYGFGRVSADGRRIEPEINPQTGRPYGLPDFSWHFPNAAPDGNPSDPDCGNQTGNTVDLATGVKIEKTTDIMFSGARGGLELTRIYTSDLAGTCDSCPFGRGATHNYAIRLTGTFQSGGAGRVVFPDQLNGRLFNYLATDVDGSLIFTTTASKAQLGDILRKRTDGTFEYRYADGSLMRFDSGGKLTAIVDRNFNTTTLSYTSGRLTQVTDAVGRSISFQYDGSGRITRATDPIGRSWNYTYEGTPGVAGTPGLTTVTDPLSNVMRYGYVTGGRLATVTDKRGVLMKQITYDSAGRVTDQRFAAGGFEHYSYSLAGNRVAQTTLSDSLGRSLTKRFNATGYVVEMVDPLGQSSKVDRDLTTSVPLKTTGPCGCTEGTREFDSRGNATAATDRVDKTTRFEYDSSFNNITKITDKLGRVTTLDYDSRGNLISIADALNQISRFEYNAFGEIVRSVDPLGHENRFEYDTLGNLTGIIDAVGARVTLEYDQVGRNTAIIDPSGRRISRSFDSLDRMISITDPAGATSTYSYDASGNLTRSVDGLQHETRANYDARNRVISMVDALGRISRLEYDTENQITALISASGRTLLYSYNARGEISRVNDALGGLVKFNYDNRGNLTAVTDKRGFTTSWAYDQLYRPILRRDPFGLTSGYSYDASNNIVESVDRLGRRATMNYDALNRLTSATYPDAVVNYFYDAASRPTRVDDSQSGSIAWTYDDAGRPLSETTPAGTVRYAYNAASQITSMTAADRPPVNYDFDASGRLHTITQGTEVFSYSYDLLSRVASIQRPNGIKTSYTYDQVNRLTRLLHEGPQSQPVEDYNLQYDLDDEIISITSMASSVLLPASANIATANAGNRITNFGGATTAFDALGQTTSKTDSQGTTSYTWDARGRLTGVSLPGGQNVVYGYDAGGRLASRTANGTATTFLYDGADIVLDHSSDGASVEYINGPGADNPLRQKGPSGSLYFLRDHLGTTTALTDATGSVSERILYEPFGDTQGSTLTRYGFAGRERDQLTGLMYNRARWYDPHQGRFLSEDPVGLSGGLNVYAYALNNPLSFFDPSGLSWQTFKQGLIDGGISGFWEGLKWGALFGLLAALTAGTGGAALVPALSLLLGLQAATALAEEIISLFTDNMCPDELHYRIGNLIGNFVGALAGGLIGGAAGFKVGRGLRGSAPGVPQTTGGGACFVAGTTVVTADGDKPIENVVAGDVVLSNDGVRGEVDAQAVKQAFVRTTNVVVDVQIGRTTITASPDHPFWVVGRGWLPAGELQPGATLRTKDGGVVTVDSVNKRHGSFTVYNIEVANQHNYYVSSLGVLVHNQNCSGGGSGGSGFPGDYLAGDAPKQVTPGVRELEGVHVNDLGRVEPWRAYYDEYGRQIGRTDYNAGNRAQGIPDTHHHVYEYNQQYPMGREVPPSHRPGPYRP